MIQKLKYAFFILLVVAAAVLFGRYYELISGMFKSDVEKAIEAQPSKEVVKEEKVEVVAPKVKAYKPQVKAKLKLPEAVVANSDQYALSTGRVAISDRPSTVTTVLDVKTGEAKTYVRQEPLPLFRVDTTTELGAYAGLRNGHQLVRVEARQNLFNVKAAHFGVVGSIDHPISGPLRADYFVGVGVWMRW